MNCKGFGHQNGTTCGDCMRTSVVRREYTTVESPEIALRKELIKRLRVMRSNSGMFVEYYILMPKDYKELIEFSEAQEPN